MRYLSATCLLWHLIDKTARARNQNNASPTCSRACCTCALILESSKTTSLRIQLAKCPDFRNFCQEETRLSFSASCMNGVKFGISKFCGRSSSVMTVIPYAGVFLNNDVRALYIFPDTVTASLLRSISKTRNETYLVWLFPISCQALIRPVSNYLLKLLTLEK